MSYVKTKFWNLNILIHRFYSLVSPEVMEKFYYYFRWDFILLGYTKLDNPNFPYLDFNQDMDKEFGYLLDDEERKDTDPREDDESPSDDYPNNKWSVCILYQPNII